MTGRERGNHDTLVDSELGSRCRALAARVREVRARRQVARPQHPAELRRPGLDRGEAPVGEE